MKAAMFLAPILAAGLVLAAASGAPAAGAAATRDFRQAVEPSESLSVQIKDDLASLSATDELEEDILQEIATRFGVTLNIHCEDPLADTARVNVEKSNTTLPELVNAATGKTHTFVYRDAREHIVDVPPAGPNASAFARRSQPSPNKPEDKLENEKLENKIVTVDAFPVGCGTTGPVARRFVGAAQPLDVARQSQPLSVAQVAAVMKSEGPLSRRHALESLRNSTEPAAAALARQAVNDPNPVVMVDAARVALILAHRLNTLPEAEQALADRFKRDPYLDLVILLAPLNKSLSWPAIEELTQSSDKTADEFAVRALALSLDPRGIPWLKQVVQEGEPGEATQAASVIGKIGGPEAVAALADLLANPNEKRRAVAIEGVALLPEAEKASLYDNVAKLLQQPGAPSALYEAFVSRNYLKPLAAMLADPHADADSKVKALNALAGAGNAQVIDVMTAAMTDQRPEVRRAAAAAIGQVIAEPGIAPLIAATKDSDAQVRANAAKGLGEFTNDDNIVGALVPLLRDPDASVRKSAIDAMVQIGKPSEAMIEAYKAARTSSDPYVAKQAADQIRYWHLGST